MLNKLIQKRNIILIIFAILFFALWTLTLIFGNSANKSELLILSIIMQFVVYGFVRLMYKIVKINAPLKIKRVFYGFFLINGAIITLSMIVEFIKWFPNGFTIAFGVSGAVIIATLDDAKKNIYIA